jgi:hypothetical protein
MATYKVWLTVKDSYGNTKELDGGTLNVDLTELTNSEVTQIEEALPLEQYVKRDELPGELNDYATDVEVEAAMKQTVKYSGFKYKEEVGE